MRTTFMLILTMLTFVVMREEFHVTDKFILGGVLIPMLLLTSLAWTEDQKAAQIVRNKKMLERERGASDSSAPESSNTPSGDYRLPDVSSENEPSLPGARIEGENFTLYLRPFGMDRFRRFRNPRMDALLSFFIPFYTMMLPDEVTFDEAVRWHLRGRSEVIALGEQEEAFGATRWTTSDTSWKEAFHILAQRAQMILVLPNMRPGTAWEIVEICTSPELLCKTVFLALLLDEIEPDSEAPSKSMRALLCQHGCKVPDDIKRSEAMLFDANGLLRDRVILLADGFLQIKLQASALHRLFDQCEPRVFSASQE